MAEPTSAFEPGRFGRSLPVPGLRVRELTDCALASVIARRGAAAACHDAARRHFGCSLPERPGASVGHEVAYLWSGPGHWLAVAAATPTDIETRLSAPLAGLASVFDQSDSRVMLELDGPRVRDVLAKGVSIDLDPRAFRPGDTALTFVSHLNVLLWQVDEAPRYRVLAVRTYTCSFWRWLASSAAEFGGEVLPPQPYRHSPPVSEPTRE